MEEKKDKLELLDMMIQPVFFVKDHIITRANAAAQHMLFREGTDIRPLLQTGAEDYAGLQEGCLYLTVSTAGQAVPAFVRPMEDGLVFELDTSGTDALRAMALASSQLRHPLTGALAQTEALLHSEEDPRLLEKLSCLNRDLYRILRLLGNMSDAEQTALFFRPTTVDAGKLFRDIFGKAQPLVEKSGLTLEYQDLPEAIYCLMDSEQLERGVLNLLSNAMKFTPKGGKITVSLTRRGRNLILTIQDSGSGIHREVLGSLFQRHLRQPRIEDSRFGIGLGLRIAHATAINHGGTLLVTQAEGGGTRVVMTLVIRQNTGGMLCSPFFATDYSGGFSHSLVELSDCLSPELFNGR